MTSDSMRNPSWRRLTGWSIAASTLSFVAGCSSDGGVSTATTGGVTSSAVAAANPASTPTTDDEDPAIAGGERVDALTLAQVYALLNVQTPSEMVTFMETNVPQAEVAACMSRAGFQFIQGMGAATEVASDPRNVLPPDEYAAKYGFGITSQQLGTYPSLPPDPNSEYLATLTSGQQAAYNQAYFPCSGGTPERIAQSNALNIAIEQFRDILSADSRVVTAIATWSACLAAAGFDYETPRSVLESFYGRMNSGISHDELERLFTEEVAVAIANVPCDAAYRTTYRELVLERIGEYQAFLAAAVASGAAPDAQG